MASVIEYIDALGKLADGAEHKVVVFEYNAGNHAMRRALGNALATKIIERDRRVPIVTSANGLQPDKQNDNGWDQGLLFLKPVEGLAAAAGLCDANAIAKLLAAGREVRGGCRRWPGCRRQKTERGWRPAPASSRQPERQARNGHDSPGRLHAGPTDRKGHRTRRASRWQE